MYKECVYSTAQHRLGQLPASGGTSAAEVQRAIEGYLVCTTSLQIYI